MNEKTLGEILAMSGYGGYVWTAFGVTLAALLVMYISSRRRLKNALKNQQRLLAEQR